MKLPLTGDAKADKLLEQNPFALLVGMLLDQQVPMEWAFHAPYDLKERLGGKLDARTVAAMDLDELTAVFVAKPALHRYPASMAGRVHALAGDVVEHYGGDAGRVWKKAKTGEELFANLRTLPGFGEYKARIFTAVLAKRLGVAPPGWEEFAGPYAQVGYYSAADVDGPGALAKVREHKKAMKAAKKAAAAK